jgi:glucose-6-phosphate 1-dehydrogenase
MNKGENTLSLVGAVFKKKKKKKKKECCTQLDIYGRRTMCSFSERDVYAVRTEHLDKQLTTRDQQMHTFFLRYLYYTITLSIPTCFSPQRIIIREQVTLRITYLAIFFS